MPYAARAVTESAKRSRLGRRSHPPVVRITLGLLAVTASALGQAAFQEGDAGAKLYRLSWHAPAECPPEAELSLKIDRLLATSTLSGVAAVLVSAEVGKSELSGFVALLSYEHENAPYERTLRADSCEALASATALIIATVIDPEAVARAQAAFAEPPPAEPPRAAEKPPVEAESPPPPAPRAAGSGARPRRPQPPFDWSLGALSWGGAGFLPELAWGIGVAASVRRRAFSLSGDFQYWGRQRLAVDPETGASVTFERYGGALRACFGLLPGRVAADACAGVELFAVRGVSFDVTTPGRGTPAFLAPALGLHGRLGLTRRFELLARLEASLPVVSHRFEIRGVGEVWELPPIAGRVGLGGAVAF